METYTINLYPVFKFVVILFAIVGGYGTINNFLHLLGRFGKDKLDAETLSKLYPLVNNEFMRKNTKEQNIENNQEIHEINIKLEAIEEELRDMRK